jgi:hypothetical protein
MVGLPIAAYLTWQGKLIEGRHTLSVAKDPQMQRALELARQL